MQAYPLPINEANRQHAVYESGLLRGPATSTYTQITDSLAEIYQVPSSYFSAVDKDRVVLIARHEIEPANTPRPGSFCAHTILHGGLLRIADVSRDRRFKSSAEHLGLEQVSFYAGVPVMCGNFPIGSLSILDTQLRTDLTASKLGTLVQAANSISNSLKQFAAEFSIERMIEAEQPDPACLIKHRGREVQVRIDGDLGIKQNLGNICERIMSAVDIHSTRAVIIDLKRCNMNRGGSVGTFLRLYRQCDAHEIRFSLRNVNPVITKILERMNLAQALLDSRDPSRAL